MADGTITIGVEVDDAGLESSVTGAAKSAGKSAGDAIESGVESAGKSAGKGAGAAIESGVEEGGKSGADGAGAAIEGLEDVAKRVGGALAAAFTVSAIGDLAGQALDAYQEMGAGMGKLKTAADQLGYSQDAANGGFMDFVGITGDADTAVEAMGTTMQLARGNTETLSEWTRIAAGVYAEFGDGLPIEGLTEAANETAKVGQVTGPFADALNWVDQSLIQTGVSLSGNAAATQAYNDAIAQGMSAEDAFNAALSACSDEGERSALITSTMSAAYDSAGDSYRENNSALIELNQAQAENQQKMAELGEALAPVQTAFTDLQTAAVDIAIQLAQVLQPAAQWFVDNLPVVAPVIAGLAASIAAIALAVNASAIATGLQTAATTAWSTAQGVLNAVMGANPFALVAALIVGLVAAFMVAWNSSEEFRNVVTGVFNAVASVVSGVVSAIVGFFTGTVPGAIGTMLGVVSGIPGAIGGFLSSALGAVGSFVGNFASKAASGARNFVSNIVSGLSGLAGRVANVGHNIVSGIWNGISGAAGWLYNKISGFASSVVSNIKGFFGIHSPSKVMRDEVGKYLAKGIAVGFDENSPLDSIQASLSAGMRSFDLTASIGEQASGAQPVAQTINFNTPVATPDVIARQMRNINYYGLAGARQ